MKRKTSNNLSVSVKALVISALPFFSHPGLVSAQISVAGNCNFIAVNADIILHSDYDLPPTCADPAWITEEYTRLFGASGVPALMALQEVNGNYRQQDHIYWLQSYRFADYFGGSGLPVGEETIRFWQNEWPHRNARALINLPLWEDYSGNIQFAAIPGTYLHSHNRFELACFFYLEPLAGLGMGFGMPVYDTQFFWKNEDTISRLSQTDCYGAETSRYEVGFTFLTLKNASRRSINELEVHYRFLDERNLAERLATRFGATNAEALLDLLETSPEFIDGVLSSMIGQDPDNAALLRSAFQPSDYVEFAASNQPSAVMKLADLAPGEATIALLNVYLTNRENGFLPIYYVDGILVPDRIVFRSGTQTISRQIRDPFRTQALRKGLSWGWSSQ